MHPTPENMKKAVAILDCFWLNNVR
jgi:hypothetical protein